MSWILSFYRSALGKKAVMAVTGIVLFGFVLGHMLGNLKLYMGAEALDHYAVFLREMGYPLLPHGVGLWIARLLLLGAVLLHIHSATVLTLASRAARGVAYEERDTLVASYASRTMRWGGVIIAAFVVYHLLHLTTGAVHPEFQHGAVFRNVVIGFQSWPASTFYIVANLLLGLHLYHGLWSMFQSLGWNHPRFNLWRKRFAQTFAIVVTLGNVSFPIAVLTGFVTLP
jgi:succinate dehydrogenase / fumarate reductase cytochrome b subunit